MVKYKQTIQIPSMHVTDFLSHVGIQFNSQDIPTSSENIDLAGERLPLYRELLVIEKAVIDAAETFNANVFSACFNIAMNLKSKNILSQDLNSLAEAVYYGIQTKSIQTYKGEAGVFDPTIPCIAAALDLLSQYPSYDPETLITLDGQNDLRMGLWLLYDQLDAVGVVGSDIYKKVAAIKDQRNLVTDLSVVNFSIADELLEYPQLYENMQMQAYVMSPAFRVDLLAYTRLGIKHSIAQSLLGSEMQMVQKQIAGEFPKEEAKVTENTNEASTIEEEPPAPKVQRVKKSAGRSA